MYVNNKRGGLSRSGNARGPGGLGIAPPAGKTSSVGHGASALPNVGGAPKPTASRRDYGKKDPAPAQQPSPFGPLIPGSS